MSKYSESEHHELKGLQGGGFWDGGGLNTQHTQIAEYEDADRWGRFVVRMADVEVEDNEWQWDRRIPMGHLTVLAGLPGQGKTYVALEVAKSLSLGEALPDSTSVVKGGTLIISTEDGVANTLKPRLVAMGADQSRIWAFNYDQVFDADEIPNIAKDIHGLEKAVIIPNDIKLIILDPLTGLLGNTDDNSNVKIRSALQELLAKIQRLGIACIGILHLNKAKGHADPMQHVLGTTALVAAPRSVLAVAPDPKDSSRHYLVSLKSNLDEQPMAVGYRISGDKVVFDPDVEDIDVQELFDHPPERRQLKTDEAKLFLLDELSGGELPQAEIERKWKDVHNGSLRTLERAKKDLDIKATRTGLQGAGKGSGLWVWSLDRRQINTAKAS